MDQKVVDFQVLRLWDDGMMATEPLKDPVVGDTVTIFFWWVSGGLNGESFLKCLEFFF